MVSGPGRSPRRSGRWRYRIFRSLRRLAARSSGRRRRGLSSLETPPLSDDLVLFGSAVVALTVDAEEPRSQLAIRLCDVSPEGVSCRVGLALFNLALDDMFDAPVPPPSRPRDIRVAFHTTAYRFRQGHRIRVALSGSYWPTAWPSPTLEEVRIAAVGGRLSLPTPPTPLPRLEPSAADAAAAAARRQPHGVIGAAARATSIRKRPSDRFRMASTLDADPAPRDRHRLWI